MPVELETILLEAIAKNPDERYGTAQEMTDDLQRFVDDKPNSTSSCPRKAPLDDRLRPREHRLYRNFEGILGLRPSLPGLTTLSASVS